MARKILIVDDVATNRIVLKVKLGAAFYDTVMAPNGAEALALARTTLPDLILLDYLLPDMDGISVTRALRADPLTRSVPVIMFTATGDEEAKLDALAVGVDDFLQKPIDDQVLLARIRNLLRDRDDSAGPDLATDDLRVCGFAEPGAGFDLPGRIALVAARPETTLRWRNTLAPHLTDRLEVLTREEALAGGLRPTPDLYIIAADLGPQESGLQGNGLQLMSHLRSHPDTRHAAICMVIPQDQSAAAAMALDLGANDQIADGFDGRETALRARTLIRRKRAADQGRAAVRQGLKLAVTDPLTGLYNRRYAMPALTGMNRVAQECGLPCAVMLIDIDRFKLVNDHHGHSAGDAVLTEVARRLSAALRPGDLLARIGGEEFLAALPDVTEPEARDVAERLCRAVRGLPITLADDVGRLTITVSIGLALSGPPPDSAAMLIERADRALLAAKAEGRNQVTFSRSAA
ncbi:MAG: diguanylate cyclase [Gemmobacter sp.]|nr:diguanylate cyclase [Gemmobacter sp.]